MSIQTGQRAPDFTLYSDQMEPFRLSDHEGERVVLLFFPGAFTRVCTDELCSVSDALHDFDGAHVVGISTDAPPVLAEFRRANGLRMPLLSDHDADVCATYGAKYDDFLEAGFSRIAKRAAFVVGADGMVRYTEVLDDAGEQPDFDAVQRALSEDGEGAATP
jgi:peroxiredoxin